MGTALILAGGGGRGAYHIGMWKALREYHITDRITAVSGTSVGALNTLLFANGDYEKSEYSWSHVCPQDVLQFDAKETAKLLLTPVAINAIGSVIPVMMPLRMSMSALAVKAMSQTLQQGVLSARGVESLILSNLDFDRIKNCPIPLFAGAFAVNKREMQYLRMDGQDADRIRQIAMASSAIPTVFPQQCFDGNHYVDGGVKDNVPVKPLYDMGFRDFIVCYLREGAKPGQLAKKFPGAVFSEIIPREKMGGMIRGSLDFTAAGAVRRMEQGYYDTFLKIQSGELSIR